MKWELVDNTNQRKTFVSNVADIGCLVLVHECMGGVAMTMQFVPGVRWDVGNSDFVLIPPPTDNFNYNVPNQPT